MRDALSLIRDRASARMPFDPARPIAEPDLERLLEAARWAPTAHNMQNYEIVVVDDPDIIDAIRAIKRPPDPVFVRENYAQLAFSEEEWREKKTGVLGTMFPPAWLDPEFSLDKCSPEELKAMSRPMPATPLLLVVLYDPARRAPASEGDFLGIVSLGCMMENLWIAAEELGIGMHIVSSLAHDPEVRALLAVPDALQIAFACRLGYPAAPPATPRLRVRRDIADFTHRNRYGA